MIRKLQKSDYDACFSLVKDRPAENLFIIGDIEAYGFEQDFQKLWGEFDHNGELIAILLNYEENYIPFASQDFDAAGFAAIMSQDPNFKMMSGLKDITEKIEPYVNRPLKRKRQTYYAKCTQLTAETTQEDLKIVEQAVPEDAEDLVTLLNSIPEFKDSMITEEKKRRSLEDRSSRSFFIKADGKIVSTASTAA